MRVMDILVFVLIAGVGYVAVAALIELVRWARRRADRGRPDAAAGGLPQYKECPRPDCRYLNPEHAEYCGRCGAPLRDG